MTKEIKVTLTEEELTEILAEHFGLSPKSAKLNIYKFNADLKDPREREYTEITFTAKEYK